MDEINFMFIYNTPMKKFTTLFFISFLVACAFADTLAYQYSITGIKGEALENVINRLNTEQKNLTKPNTSTQAQKFNELIPINVEKALEPYGYFHSNVQSRIYQIRPYKFKISVTPGPVTIVQSANIKLTGPGANNAALRKYLLKAKKKLHSGKRLNTSHYDEIKKDFFTIAEQQGYMKGYFSQHKIRINRKINRADVSLTFNTGPRYYFGAVYFSKNPMATSFLRRYLPFKPGEPFSSDKLLSLQNTLGGTIYFSNVSVDANVTKANQHHEVPVKVQLTPAKAQQYSLGLGYGTDTGARASYGWQWRRVTSTGHYIQTLAQVTQKQNDTFQARYVIPGKHPATDHYALTAGIFTNRPGDNGDQYTTEQIGGSYTQFRYNWLQTFALQYQHENYTVDNVSNTANTLIPSVSFEKVVANNRINTINGYKIRLMTQAGANFQNSDGSFFQGEVRGKYIKSFTKQRYRLILYGDLGATYVKNFANMPLSQRFFAGGANTLRGYDYQDLGPGRFLTVGGVEWQFRLHGNFYGSVLYNAGNATQNFSLDLKQAAGVGLLYRSPIGPIEITVSHPFENSTSLSTRNYVIQFTMGPDL